MVDVMALLSEAKAREGQGCHTCKWLGTRPDDERAKWAGALAETGSYNSAQISRAMAAADPDGAPGVSSIINHRGQHRRTRGEPR